MRPAFAGEDLFRDGFQRMLRVEDPVRDLHAAAGGKAGPVDADVLGQVLRTPPVEGFPVAVLFPAYCFLLYQITISNLSATQRWMLI